eukprot:4486253-Alexandrium_andersonii.AAC.1
MRLTSRACVPSSSGACMAGGLPLPIGMRCKPPRWRASGLLGEARPCCFYHAELDAGCVVHGDGFAFAGYDILDVIEKLMNEKFSCKVEGRLGNGPRD